MKRRNDTDFNLIPMAMICGVAAVGALHNGTGDELDGLVSAYDVVIHREIAKAAAETDKSRLMKTLCSLPDKAAIKLINSLSLSVKMAEQYAARNKTMYREVKRLIDWHDGEPVVVVNLGCGFDPIADTLANYRQEVSVINVDGEDVLEKRLALFNKVGIPTSPKNIPIKIQGEETINELFDQIETDDGSHLIVFAKGVFPYMPPEDVRYTIESVENRDGGIVFSQIQRLNPLRAAAVGYKSCMDDLDGLHKPYSNKIIWPSRWMLPVIKQFCLDPVKINKVDDMEKIVADEWLRVRE